MEIRSDFLDLAQRAGDQLRARVIARDELHLRPVHLTRAAAARFKTGLRALKLYLRRLILLMALRLEHDLVERRPVQSPAGRRAALRSPTVLSLAEPRSTWPGALAVEVHKTPSFPPGHPVSTEPLWAQFDALTALLRAPEARARRLAWHLARRVDFVCIPDFGKRLGVRLVTEPDLVFTVMGRTVQGAAQARPPPLGPPPRPPPRLRRV